MWWGMWLPASPSPSIWPLKHPLFYTGRLVGRLVTGWLLKPWRNFSLKKNCLRSRFLQPVTLAQNKTLALFVVVTKKSLGIFRHILSWWLGCPITETKRMVGSILPFSVSVSQDGSLRSRFATTGPEKVGNASWNPWNHMEPIPVP